MRKLIPTKTRHRMSAIRFFPNGTMETKIFDLNLVIATSVLKEIKQSVVSSHDIIPSHLVNSFLYSSNPAIRNSIQVRDYHAYKDICRRIKERIHPADATIPTIHEYREIVESLVRTECGIGESKETSDLAIIKLIQNGCKNVHRVQIRSTPNPDGSFNYLYFVLVGDISPLKSGDSLSTFSKINKNCVVIAPSINVVGQASQLNTLLKNHIQAFKLNEVTAVITVSERFQKAVPDIVSKAKKFGSYFKSQGYSYSALNQEAHKSIVNGDEYNKLAWGD